MRCCSCTFRKECRYSTNDLTAFDKCDQLDHYRRIIECEREKIVKEAEEERNRLLALCQRQNTDLIYLMLEINAHRQTLSAEGLKALCTLRMMGGENGEKYSIEEVDKRIKKGIETLESIRRS